MTNPETNPETAATNPETNPEQPRPVLKIAPIWLGGVWFGAKENLRGLSGTVSFHRKKRNLLFLNPCATRNHASSTLSAISPLINQQPVCYKPLVTQRPPQHTLALRAAPLPLGQGPFRSTVEAAARLPAPHERSPHSGRGVAVFSGPRPAFSDHLTAHPRYCQNTTKIPVKFLKTISRQPCRPSSYFQARHHR